MSKARSSGNGMRRLPRARARGAKTFGSVIRERCEQDKRTGVEHGDCTRGGGQIGSGIRQRKKAGRALLGVTTDEQDGRKLLNTLDGAGVEGKRLGEIESESVEVEPSGFNFLILDGKRFAIGLIRQSEPFAQARSLSAMGMAASIGVDARNEFRTGAGHEPRHKGGGDGTAETGLPIRRS